jgi:hypothetical protein
MTVAPQMPETPPGSAKRAPASLVYGAIANGSWLFAWPIVFVVLLSPTALESKAAHWLSIGGFTLWILSMFSFYGFLRALAEYSSALSAVLDGLGFVLEALFLLLG